MTKQGGRGLSAPVGISGANMGACGCNADVKKSPSLRFSPAVLDNF